MPNLASELANSEERMFVYVKDGNIRICKTAYNDNEKEEHGILLVGLFSSVAYFQRKDKLEAYVAKRNDIITNVIEGDDK